MDWIRFSGWLFVLLVVATAVVMGVGGRLPAEQQGHASGVVQGSRQQVWDRLTAVEMEPRWRSDVSAVEMAQAQGGLPCWREQQGRFAVLQCAVAADAPRLWMVRVMDPQLPFGGTRRYELTAATEGQTRVTIVDDMTAGPAMWRFARRYLHGPNEAAERTLGELQAGSAGGASPAGR